MTWNYKNPEANDKDKVRFLIGDTDSTDPLVSDEEILHCITKQTRLELAAAMTLRALAAKFSRMVDKSMGGISARMGQIAKAFSDRANELDPGRLTANINVGILPVFGGVTIAEKMNENADYGATQPAFKKGMNDDPRGMNVDQPLIPPWRQS